MRVAKQLFVGSQRLPLRFQSSGMFRETAALGSLTSWDCYLKDVASLYAGPLPRLHPLYRIRHMLSELGPYHLSCSVMDWDCPPDSPAKIWTLNVTVTKGRTCGLKIEFI